MGFDVIIPTYKVSPEFIQQALTSVESQTIDNWHCWIIDGTPETHETYDDFMSIMNVYDAKDNFSYLRQSGTGVSQARNEAISLGDATHIATLDGDDFWYPEHLEWMTEAINLLESNTVLWWAGADAEIVIQSIKTGEIYSHEGVLGWFRDYVKIRPEDHYFFLRGHAVIPSNSVFLRSRFEAVNGYDETLQISEDTDLYLRMLGNPLEETKTFRGCQFDAVSGYHGCGPWQTTQMGGQTSAAEGRTVEEIKEEFTKQTSTSLHKVITMEDKPSEVTEEYWQFVIDSILSNQDSIPATVMDSDHL
jgi:glycosyltransferase involved in cell wall biosynthesis|tara:strand:+ start:1897 stop:2811 length:915 start_codon:yes stop_codon:yes gene_type:complete